MGELLVILVIALLVLRAEEAAGRGHHARQVRPSGSFRKATQDLTDQLQVDDEVKRPLQELKAALRDEPEPHHIATQKPAPKPAAPIAVEAVKPIAVEAIKSPEPAAAPKTEKA